MLTSYVMAMLRLKLDRRAVTAIEYALVAALVFLVIIGAIANAGKSLTSGFNKVASEL